MVQSVSRIELKEVTPSSHQRQPSHVPFLPQWAQLGDTLNLTSSLLLRTPAPPPGGGETAVIGTQDGYKAHPVPGSWLVILPHPLSSTGEEGERGLALIPQMGKVRPTEEGNCLALALERGLAEPTAVVLSCTNRPLTGPLGPYIQVGAEQLHQPDQPSWLFACSWDRLAQALNAKWSSVEFSGPVRLKTGAFSVQGTWLGDKSWGEGPRLPVWSGCSPHVQVMGQVPQEMGQAAKLVEAEESWEKRPYQSP